VGKFSDVRLYFSAFNHVITYVQLITVHVKHIIQKNHINSYCLCLKIHYTVSWRTTTRKVCILEVYSDLIQGVLDNLYEYSAVKKNDITAKLGVSTATVSHTLRDPIAQKIINAIMKDSLQMCMMQFSPQK